MAHICSDILRREASGGLVFNVILRQLRWLEVVIAQKCSMENN